MRNFEYYTPTQVLFGKDTHLQAGSLLKKYGAKKVLIHYGGQSAVRSGLIDEITSNLKEEGLEYITLGGVIPNPLLSKVREGIELCQKEHVDFILAVGGGSSIDTAKAVALAIPYEGDAWDFFDKGVLPETVLPTGVISTLPASGSETSNCAILSNGEWKLGFEDDRIIPKFAIMNPEYTTGLPDYQTSCGVADILSHLLERYFSDVKHTDVTDYLIEGAVKALLVNGERLVKNPKDLDARAEIQWLASIAHNNLLDTGRIGDWGSHRIEHELSAQYGITHGEGMAVVLVAWTRYMAKVKPWKLAQMASRVFGVDAFDYSEEERALALSNKLKEFFTTLNLKTTLTELEIGTEHFSEMAARATKNGAQTVGHYVPLDQEKFKAILELALM